MFQPLIHPASLTRPHVPRVRILYTVDLSGRSRDLLRANSFQAALPTARASAIYFEGIVVSSRLFAVPERFLAATCALSSVSQARRDQALARSARSMYHKLQWLASRASAHVVCT